MDNDQLVRALEGVIASYQKFVGPFAIELIAFLSTRFFKFLSVEEDEEDEGEAEIAAS